MDFTFWSKTAAPIVGSATLSDSEHLLALAVREAPKVELHFHVEGALPETTQEQSSRSSLVSPQERFFEQWRRALERLQSPTDFRTAARIVVERLRLSGVVWAEVFISPPDYEARQHSPMPFKRGLAEWVEAFANEASGACEIKLIVDLVRLYPEAVAAAHLRDLLDIKRFSGDMIIGIGFGGPENSYPLSAFESVVNEARDHGLISVAHAGEMGNALDVEDAVLKLKVDRIGHALGLQYSHRAYEYVKANHIPIEVCPSSSVATHACLDLQQHPARAWLADGVPLCISTDDPAIFKTELTLEYLAMHRALGWTPSQVSKVIISGIRCSKMPCAQMEAAIEGVHNAFSRYGLGCSDHAQ